eukprot:jgi/Galph1/3791/GphlegSOOS_G2461.1
MEAFIAPSGTHTGALKTRSHFVPSSTLSETKVLHIKNNGRKCKAFYWPFTKRQRMMKNPRPVQHNKNSVMMTREQLESSGEAAASAQPVKSVQKLVTLSIYIGCWYAANIFFNILNKRVLKVFPLFATVTLVQFLMGSLVGLALWITGLHRFEPASWEDIGSIYPLALSHLIGNVLTNISLRQVAVSFTHTIKAAEPFFSVALSKLFIPGTTYSPLVYLSLIPIVGGVTLASASEVSFNWTGFLTAMSSNVAFQSRNVLSKKFMKGIKFDNLNLFAYISILSFLTMLPFTLILESSQWKNVITRATSSGVYSVPTLLTQIALAGFLHFLYNQFSYVVLKRVNPVTHAVGNTMKRVAVIVSSVIVFKNEVTRLNKIGTAIAIAGVALYSQVKGMKPKKQTK